MTMNKVLSNASVGVGSGEIASEANTTIVRCSSGSVSVKFDGGVTYKTITAPSAYVFETIRGDILTNVAESEGTTAYVGHTNERGG